MKKFAFSFLFIALTIALSLLTACSDDNKSPYTEGYLDFQNSTLTFNQDNIWNGTFTENNFIITPFEFSHEGVQSSWGDYYTGFTLSTATGNTPAPDLTTCQYNVMAGKGMYSTSPNPFIVAYWNTSEPTDSPLEDRSLVIKKSATSSNNTFEIKSIDICNTVYAYGTMLDGSQFSKKFTEGDYLKVIAHGIAANGSERTSDFYLANCNGNPEHWYVTSWTNWDLSSLGEITALWFSMESSDSGQWGMNTPSYFAVGSIYVKYKN